MMVGVFSHLCNFPVRFHCTPDKTSEKNSVQIQSSVFSRIHMEVSVCDIETELYI